jgi:plastocyanin
MTRTRLALVAVVAALALVVAAGAQAGGTLVGVDGPGFTITLTQGGKKVTKLKAGSYTIKVSDKSSIHNFHLVGPGVNKSTSVPKVGASSWTVTLKKGTYKFVCDPHATSMKGVLRVT